MNNEPRQTVLAKCVACGATREISAREILAGEVPFCNLCHNPMIAVKAKTIFGRPKPGAKQ
jgi:hypothetical protein